MTADLVLTDDGLTVEFDSVDECSDLTAGEAETVTGRIRQWVNDFPVADVVLAFRGRVWIALAYASWSEWCECELGGLKLPAPKRREIVAELAGAGMSNRAIADTIGVGKDTIGRDLSTVANATVCSDRKTLGQDGRERRQPLPKSVVAEPEEVIEAELVCRDCDGNGCETCFPVDDNDPREEAADHTESERTAPQDQKPRRRPITDAFGSANFELRRAVERVVRLADDDRLKKNKDQIVGANLSDLIRARDALTGVIQQLEG